MKICPFISHLLGDGSSNALSIGSKSTDGSATDTPGDVVILGYDDDGGSPSVRTQVLTENIARTDTASHLYCLKESCRFYQKASKECQFDLIYATLRESDSEAKGPDARQIARDIDKIWKFQTKGVAEIVESLADSEKKQTESMIDLKKELVERIERRSGAVADQSLQPIQDELVSLKQKVEGSGEGLEGLSTTVSDFVTSLEDNLRELRSMTNDLARQISEIKTSLPREDKIAETVRGPLDAAVEAQKDIDRKLSSWKDEIAEKLLAVTSRQDSWEERIEEIVEHQKELSAHLEEGRKSREQEQSRQSKKESKKFNTLGVTSFHNGAYELARDQFLQAVKLDPEFAEAFNNLGLAYTELNEEEKATEAFTKAVELNPDLHAAYNNLGYAFYRQGNYEQAVEMYNEALGRSTNNSPAYTNLGNAYYRLGRIDKAREAWNKAVELDPSNERAKRNLNRLSEPVK
jgi:tetratricopeptide (TPR) repeat protein